MIPHDESVHQYACAHQNYREAAHHSLAALASELERDAMTMALRLYAESDDTMSPEMIEIMKKWRPRVRALLESA